MELMEAILKRRSARSFKSDHVPEEVITEMLKAAQAAPSGGNGQPHIFGIIRDEKIKKALAKAAGNQMWIADAPLVIACCAVLDENPCEMPDDDFGIEVNKLRWGSELWRYMTEYSDWDGIAKLLANAAPMIPTEHIFLTAVSHGMSACFVGWLDVEKASEILKLPDDVKCLFLLPVGYPTEPPAPIERKSLDEISFCDTY